MPVNEMYSVKHVVPWTSGQNQVLKSNGCKPQIYINSCHTHSFFEVLQSLRKEEALCDIKLQTDDGVIVCAHKIVLVSCSPYFRAMFTGFAKGNKDIVVHLRELDSNILQRLVDYIYIGEIMVTEQNVMVGGCIDGFPLNTTEIFDVSIQEWQLISSMCTRRINPGDGVLNNLLYAVGGYICTFALKSVESYDPSLDTWSPVIQMSTRRRGPAKGVLDGVMYAIDGKFQEYDSSRILKSVEAYTPIAKVWSPIADMHVRRANPEVVTFNGLLYVIGGFDEYTRLDSVQIYNPKNNTWTMESFPTSVARVYSVVVINLPSNMRTD